MGLRDHCLSMQSSSYVAVLTIILTDWTTCDIMASIDEENVFMSISLFDYGRLLPSEAKIYEQRAEFIVRESVDPSQRHRDQTRPPFQAAQIQRQTRPDTGDRHRHSQ